MLEGFASNIKRKPPGYGLCQSPLTQHLLSRPSCSGISCSQGVVESFHHVISAPLRIKLSKGIVYLEGGGTAPGMFFLVGKSNKKKRQGGVYADARTYTHARADKFARLAERASSPQSEPMKSQRFPPTLVLCFCSSPRGAPNGRTRLQLTNRF